MIKPPDILPSNFDRALFLREYWQKKPLLIRAADDSFSDPISAEELAGLACEDCIESRLIVQDTQKNRWAMERGPFTEKRFKQLPDGPWSLLVQAVDQWHEGVRALLKGFDFIPNWRIDDVMISYATDTGGVGPHFDYYDVFLIQGAGQKRWQLGGHADGNSPCIADNDLRLLADFKVEEEWVANPGDILYLPPNYAHHGVAIGASITYSVGFRTPSLAEIIDDLSHELIQNLPQETRYIDTNPQLPSLTGEMTPNVGQQLSTLVTGALADPERLAAWFARYMTRPKYPDQIEALDDPVSSSEMSLLIDSSGPLLKNPCSRFAFSKTPAGYDLHADGETLSCAAAYIDILPPLCDTQNMDEDWGPVLASLPSGSAIAASLYNQGSLLFAEDMYEDDNDTDDE